MVRASKTWGMPQMQLPIFSDGVTPITNDVGYERKENSVVYYCGTMPVFSHSVDDLDSFRMIVSQLYVNGTVCQANLTRAFQIKPRALKRWVKRYRAEGARAFFQSRTRGCKPKDLTPEVRARVQSRLDQGQSLSEIRKGRLRDCTGCFAGAVGTTTPGTAVLRCATATLRTSGTTILGSVRFWPQVSELRNGEWSCPEQTRRREGRAKPDDEAQWIERVSSGVRHRTKPSRFVKRTMKTRFPSFSQSRCSV